MQVIRGEETGAIAKNGKELFKQYDYFCGRHAHPIKMIPVHVEEMEKKPNRFDKLKETGKILVTLSKMCLRCHNTIFEGQYVKD